MMFKRGDIAIFTPKKCVDFYYRVVVLDNDLPRVDNNGNTTYRYRVCAFDAKGTDGIWKKNFPSYFHYTTIEELYETEEEFNNQNR